MLAAPPQRSNPMASSATASLAEWTASQLARLTGGAPGAIDASLIDYLLSLTDRDDVLAFVQVCGPLPTHA